MDTRERIIDYLFPDVDRDFQGMRWLNILLRTTHLIGVAGAGGAFFYDIPVREWTPFLGFTIVSGLMLMFLAIWSNGIWLLQLRGVATMVKLAVLSLSFSLGMDATILLVVIGISGVISHAPGKVRYHMVFRGPNFGPRV